MTFTTQQAFQIMYLFLEKQYKKTNSDDLGWLLGGLCWHGLAGEKPEFWDYWETIIKKLLNKNENIDQPRLTNKQSFQAMYFFLNKIFDKESDLPIYFNSFDLEQGEPNELELKKDWHEAIEKISNGIVDGSYFRFRITN